MNRPVFIVCADCPIEVPVKARGRLPERCPLHASERLRAQKAGYMQNAIYIPKKEARRLAHLARIAELNRIWAQG